MYRIVVVFLFVFLINGINSQGPHCKTNANISCRQHFQNLYRDVSIKDSIIICLKSIPNGNHLVLNLQENRDENNIPLHLSLRFDENILLRNSKIDGNWGTEERTENLYSNVNSLANLKPGETFTIQILIEADKYYISVNGKEFATFVHRMPISKIHAVMSFGDLDRLSSVQHISTFPQFSFNCSNTKCVNENPRNYAYATNFPNKFIPGNIISVSGRATGEAGRFALRFRESSTGRDLFHFNPRFSEKKIIRSSMDTNLVWMAEETDGPFPFVLNQDFKISIGIDVNAFRFAVNGIDVGTFQFRDANLLDKLDEFAIKTTHGLNLQVTEIDIINTESTNFENLAQYSKMLGGTTDTTTTTTTTTTKPKNTDNRGGFLVRLPFPFTLSHSIFLLGRGRA